MKGDIKRMSVVSDIWKSISGNFDTRVKDPVIGTFALSWIFFNWDKLAFLLLGSKKLDDRIVNFSQKVAVIDDPSLIFSDFDLLLLPIIFSAIYLFGVPRLSLWVKQRQRNVVVSQHSEAVDLDIIQAQKQRNLNKERLLSNPDKSYLENDLKLDLKEKEERIERRNKIQECIDNRLSAAKDLANKNKAEAQIALQKEKTAQLELEEREKRKETEQARFEYQAKVLNASAASNRFPSAYFYLLKLSTALRQDHICLSLEGVAECVAAIWGYKSFQDLLNDKKFTNESLEKVKYVLASDELVKRVNQICVSESNSEEKIEPEVLFDHIQTIFEESPIEFLSEDGLADLIYHFVTEDSSDILNSDELSGPMAETDTIFDYLELHQEGYELDNGFSVELMGHATGHHRRDHEIPGQGLSVKVIALAKPLVGTYGYGELEYEISGEPTHYE